MIGKKELERYILDGEQERGKRMKNEKNGEMRRREELRFFERRRKKFSTK